MKKLLLLLCILFASILVLRIKPIRASSGDIWVPDGYPSIQAAINAASPGDIIHVRGGPYLEHLNLNKSLWLVGEGGTATIDGNGTGNVIEIRASSVLIANFTLRNAQMGIWMSGRSNCIVENNNIRNISDFGVFVGSSSRISILDNAFTNTTYCAELDHCLDCTLRGNRMTEGHLGIVFYSSNGTLIEGNYIAGMRSGPTACGIELLTYSASNTVMWNNVVNNTYGIWLTNAQDNIIYHNNFINNTNQFLIFSYTPCNNWDIGWPDGGNYWSDHAKIDSFNGEHQNQPGSDGICDGSYNLGTLNIDKYPLLGPINTFSVPFGFITEHVLVISNSTITVFDLNTTQKILRFNATGTAGVGFCRVDIPNTIVEAMWQGNYTVLVDDQPPLSKRNWTAGSMNYVYLTYLHSEHEIVIVPEFGSFLILPLFMIATLLTVIAYRRKSSF